MTASAVEQPAGVVTFLFTDIEGSTRLLEQHPEEYPAALARHHALLRDAIRAQQGFIFESVGDAIYAAFARPTDAVCAARAAQLGFQAEPWPRGLTIRVRMGIHTGEAQVKDGHYFGAALYRCARLAATAHGGQVVLSSATAELLAGSLTGGVSLRDLGQHRLKDLQRSERVFQLLHPELPSAFPHLRVLSGHPNNLLFQTTRFVGREQEIKTVISWLHTGGARLVTLTGPGGTGKTRLALQIAANLLEDFPDGAFFVALAAIRDPALVVPSLAQVLGLGEAADRPLIEILKDFLCDKHMLLVLDNFEQVAAAAPAVSELLSTCGTLRFLVTSRQRLHVYGERVFPVPPLQLPEIEHLASPPLLIQNEAVRLFVERAAAIDPRFFLTVENGPLVAEICQRLDGLPLAIELAAARVKVLSPQEMLARLERRLPLLTGGPTDLLDRQQTLRKTIDWSYDLLDAGTQELFRRLAVFARGCTLAAVEAVCCPCGDASVDPLERLTALVEKSLLHRDEACDEPRFLMLETIQEYALDRLTTSGEVERFRAQHATYYLKLAEEGAPELWGPQEARWFDRLEREHDNFRLALECFLKHDRAEEGLRLAAALSRFWRVRGHLIEGRDRLSTFLSLSGADKASSARTQALSGAGWLVRDLGDYKAASALFDESLALAREIYDRRGIAEALLGLGFIARYEGDYTGARARYQESLEGFQGLGSRAGIAAALGNLGLVARDQSDYAAARKLLEASLAMAREIEDKLGVAWALTNLGLVSRYEGDHAAARMLHDEALKLYRELGDRQNIAYSLNNLGLVALDQEEFAMAHQLFSESLRILEAVSDRRGLSFVLESLALVAVAQGRWECSLRIGGAASALRERLGAAAPQNWRRQCDSSIERARQSLDAPAARAAWTKGREMSLKEAIAYALSNEVRLHLAEESP